MPSQSWVAIAPTLPYADGTAQTNFTTEAVISPAPAITIPANFLTAGSRLRCTARGRWSQGTATNYTLQIRWGGTGGVSWVSSGAIAAGAATNLTWELRADIQVRVGGATGNVMCTGHILGITAAGGVNMLPSSAPAVSGSSDFTTAKTLDLTCSSSVGTNCGIQVHEWIVETLA
jgi:hypothetical protein